jgi:hypothetical protein
MRERENGDFNKKSKFLIKVCMSCTEMKADHLMGMLDVNFAGVDCREAAGAAPTALPNDVDRDTIVDPYNVCHHQQCFFVDVRSSCCAKSGNGR